MNQLWNPKRVLIVEGDRLFAAAFHSIYTDTATLAHCVDFPRARKTLLSEEPPALLVTNLRLGAYNGLHLVFLAKTSRAGTASIVYAEPMDLGLAREAQRIGAFVESKARVVHALKSYLTAVLPPRDRRSPDSFDRRRTFRGGRRAADGAALAHA
jgi:DNA-binding NtrC family response regulator